MKHIITSLLLVLLLVFNFISPLFIKAWTAADAPLSYELFANTPGFLFQINTDSVGNVYAANAGDSKIWKFDSNGNFLTSFGTAFSGPTGVAVLTDSVILVVNYQNDKMEKWTSAGVFISNFGSSGAGNNQFSGPYGVAVDSNSNIYVADSFNNRVQKFDSNFTYLATITGNGGAFSSPESVAIDGSDNLYVLDSGNGRVQVFNSSGTFIRTFSGSGGAWNFPEGFGVDSAGNTYVSDSGNDRIQVFDSTGTFGSQFGTSGVSLGQFQYAAGIAFDSTGNVYIADQNRIQKVIFDKTIPSLTVNNPPPSTMDPGGLTITGSTTDTQSNISTADYVIDGGSPVACTAGDGSYNSFSETFTCSIPTLSAGMHIVSIRGTDSYTNTNTATSNVAVTSPGGSSSTPGVILPQPGSSPVIFNSEVTDTTVTIFFYPAWPPLTGYILFYGTDPNNLQYGVQQFGNATTTSYTVGALAPGTTYYFVLTGMNGAQPGPSSQVFSTRTSSGALAFEPEPTLTPTASPSASIAPTPASPVSSLEPSPEPPAIGPAEPETFNLMLTDLIGNPVEDTNISLTSTSGELGSGGTSNSSGVVNVTVVPGTYNSETTFRGETFKSQITLVAGINDSKVTVPVVTSPGGNVIITPAKATEVVNVGTKATAAVAVAAFALGTAGAAAIAAKSMVGIYALTGRSFLNFPLDLFKSVGSWQSNSLAFALSSASGFDMRPPKSKNGTVFDSVQSAALSDTHLLFYSDSGNLKTTFTDRFGKYSVSPKPDSYNMKAEKNNYFFPSTVITATFSDVYGRIYTVGQKIEVTEENPLITDVSVPLDPKKLEGGALLINKTKQSLSKTAQKGQLMFGITGLIFSGYAATFNAALLNKVMFLSLVGYVLIHLTGRIYSKLYIKSLS